MTNPAGSIKISTQPANNQSEALGEIQLELKPSGVTTAALTHKPGAKAALIHDPNAEADGKDKPYALYGRVGTKIFKSRLLESKSPHCEKLDKQLPEIWKIGNSLLRKYWDNSAKKVDISLSDINLSYNNGIKIRQSDFRKKIEETIQKNFPSARDLAIDFIEMSVRYRDGDEFKEIETGALPKEVKEIMEFLNLWQNAHETAMLIMGIRVWNTRLGNESNRPLHGEKPFVIENNNLWNEFLPKTHAAFLNSHFNPLLKKIPEDRRDQAYVRVNQTWKFIEEMKQKIDAQIQAKAQASEPESEIAHLKKIKERLEEINLYAVYWAVSFWDHNNLNITSERQSVTAQEVTNGLMEVFSKTRDISKDKVTNPFNSSLPPLTALRSTLPILGINKPEKDDLKSFAIQVGDLYFHSDLDYLTRFDSTGARRPVRPSIEEFVVHNMMRINQTNYIDDLQSFGMNTLDPKKQQELREIIQEARAAVQ